MKSISLFAVAALALSGAAAFAQTQSQDQTQPQVDPQAQTQGSTVPAPAPTPAPIVIETKVDLTTEPGPPADLHAAREEAVNALAWAKAEGCRSDPSPRECVRRAQDDYKATMARLGGRH
jgi:poly(3-hydroxybutyrate) depolymerase